MLMSGLQNQAAPILAVVNNSRYNAILTAEVESVPHLVEDSTICSQSLPSGNALLLWFVLLVFG